MITIACKSGLTFQCHPIGGQVFASVDEANNTTGEQAIRRTFNTCHVHTDDSGPYNHAPLGSSKPDWDKIHFSDMLHAMFSLRKGSFTQPRSENGYVNALGQGDERPVGQILEFELPCSACGKLFESAVDLDEVIETGTEWTDEVRMAVSRSEDIKTVTRAGDTILWRPSTMALNKPMADAMKRIVGPQYGTRHRPEGVVEIIVKHVVKVHTKVPGKGGALEDKVLGPDIRALHKWFTRPGNGEDLDLMLRELDRRQPTVSNEVMLTCTHCGVEQRRALPFGGTYFFPSTSQQSKRALAKMLEREREERRKKQEQEQTESPAATSSGSSSPTSTPAASASSPTA